MTDPAKAIEAIREARPPATDRFTYLTIVEANLSPEVLPTVNEVLQDAALTQEIGWDLVFNLVNLPGSEACLETIARLGNPREVILKVLETLELLEEQEGYDADDEDNNDDKKRHATAVVSADKKFIALMGMLAILHKRIKTKYPSRFLAQSLQTVYGAYVPNEERTAAVINLVYSLSKQKRPPLPSRKSSINVANPDLEGDSSKNAPDPEADDNGGKGGVVDEAEDKLQQRLLLSFATCVLEGYANGNDMAWAARLVEYLNPYKIVTGRKTLMAKFREDEGLLARDAIVGKLVALIGDLGLESCSKEFVNQLCEGPVHSEPLTGTEDLSSPDQIALSTGGCVCLLAYWVFSLTVFDAQHRQPDLHIFPEHYAVLDKFLQDDAHSQIQKSAGTVESLVAIGLWLHSNDRISAGNLATPITKPITSPDDPTSDFMRYIHLVTLIALFHPQIHVRNAASTLAGLVLHSDPSDEDRLRVLYDLLENCTFASLKARAVAWLREEIIARSGEEQQTVFNTPQALETVQYVVFPNLDFLEESSTQEAAEYLVGNATFLMQAVNFGLFLWGESTDGKKRWGNVLLDNMEATVRGRWFEPLVAAVDKVLKREGKDKDEIELGPVEGELRLLRLRMEDLEAAEGFTAKA